MVTRPSGVTVTASTTVRGALASICREVSGSKTSLLSITVNLSADTELLLTAWGRHKMVPRTAGPQGQPSMMAIWVPGSPISSTRLNMGISSCWQAESTVARAEIPAPLRNDRLEILPMALLLSRLTAFCPKWADRLPGGPFSFYKHTISRGKMSNRDGALGGRRLHACHPGRIGLYCKGRKNGEVFCMELKGKCVLLGITGGIAAYKMAGVASALKKQGADVEVIMTRNATQFITPITFETLTGHKCMVDTFDRDFKFEVTHIELAKKADVILVAPATANVIAKMAHGIADDMLTTTVLAAGCPKLVAPAMNTGMLENPITQDNIRTLERYGFTVIPSESGLLACHDVGKGRLPADEVLLDYIHRALAPKDLAGLRVTVTAGPTQEAIDPVRCLTNHSTGKMGYAVARAAALRGAQVTLIHGPTALAPVRFAEDVPVVSAQEMYQAVTGRFADTDILVMAAAVADYRPASVASDKVKKGDGEMSIPLVRTADILGTIGPQKTHQFLCGFSMETRDMVAHSAEKLRKKNLDMIVANNLKDPGAGFGVDTNLVTFLTPDGGVRQLPLMSKEAVAGAILDEILARRG